MILQSNSWYDALLLFSCLPRLKILVPDKFFRHFPWINGFFESIRIVPKKPNTSSTLEVLFRQAKRFQGHNFSVCLFFHQRTDNAEIINAYKNVFGMLQMEIVYAHKRKDLIPSRFLFFKYNQKQITLTFSKEEL